MAAVAASDFKVEPSKLTSELGIGIEPYLLLIAPSNSLAKAAAYFHGANRGKSSKIVDFNNDEHLRGLHDLISQADIVIENFKVGGLEKYGLDYES